MAMQGSIDILGISFALRSSVQYPGQACEKLRGTRQGKVHVLYDTHTGTFPGPRRKIGIHRWMQVK